MANEMTRGNHGLGTFDKTTKKWKLRNDEAKQAAALGLKPYASLKTLSEKYHVNLTTESQS